MQLNTNQSAATCDAVRRLLDDWRTRGGTLSWGTGAQASCFPILEAPDSTECWPWTLKPTSGTLKVVFQHLLGRPPFDDTAVRDQLRHRVNPIPGVDIPLSRLELRPSFPLARLAADEGLTAAIDTYAWIVDRLRLGTEAA